MYKMTRTIFPGLLLAFATSCSSTIGSQLTEANHDAAIYNTAESCSLAISQPATAQYSTFLESDDITLLSWNIEKGKNSGWKNELKNLAEDVQFVLLQEAVFIDEMKENPDEAPYWSFSPGFETDSYRSGIMTLSHIQPDLICSLQQQEPWLRTPKIASITRFQLKDNEQALLLVNIHQINFTMGVEAFSEQLEEVASVLKAHDGPIILSGDFNTWRQSRLDILNQLTSELQLSSASFSPDYRKEAFGHHLDHIFTRGFDIKESYTEEVITSDHNPLTITLSLQERVPTTI